MRRKYSFLESAENCGERSLSESNETFFSSPPAAGIR